jgi:hypothetical protein
MRIGSLIILLLLLARIGNAQDDAAVLLAELKSWRKAYESMPNFYTQIEVVNKDLNTSESLTMKGEISKKGDWCHYKIGEHEILLNAKYLLRIDHENKAIYYQIVDKKQIQKQDVMPDFEEVFKKYSKITAVATANGGKKYVLEAKNSAVYKVEMYLSKDIKLMDKLIYWHKESYYNTHSQTTMTFRKATFSPVFAADTFAETRIIRIENNKIYPSAKYKNYQILRINQ